MFSTVTYNPERCIFNTKIIFETVCGNVVLDFIESITIISTPKQYNLSVVTQTVASVTVGVIQLRIHSLSLS